MSSAAASAGFRLATGHLGRAAQEALMAELARIIEEAPFFRPRMPRTNKPFSVLMTNCGALGWVADKESYRYQAIHPETGRPWPEMPALVRELWAEFAPEAPPAEACLVNYYAPGSRMGLHQDRDEAELDAPVVSLSLGDTCVFRIGGTRRGNPTRSVRLSSGDVIVLGGEARLAYHGVDRLIPGTSTLLGGYFPDGGRINLTLRRVNPV